MTSDQPTSSECESLLYADDSITYCSSPSPIIAARKVESHVRRLHDFYKKWGIHINTGKSELICFRRPTNSRGRRAGRCRSISISLPDGSTLAAKRNTKYLGVHFNEMMKFNPHSRAVLKKANHALHRLNPLLRRRTGLSKPTKLLIYKQLIRPVITYSFPVWYTISKTAMKELQVFERKVLRSCTGLYFNHQRRRHFSNKRLYEEAKITPLDKYLIQSAKRIAGSLSNHPNNLINGITTQQRHPEPRYLCTLDVLREELEQTNDEGDLQFYADTGSAFNRG